MMRHTRRTRTEQPQTERPRTERPQPQAYKSGRNKTAYVPDVRGFLKAHGYNGDLHTILEDTTKSEEQETFYYSGDDIWSGERASKEQSTAEQHTHNQACGNSCTAYSYGCMRCGRRGRHRRYGW